jgi:phytoene dehydrogenase-like protein
MRNSVVVIGAGMGGLAAGIYGQLNGFDTQIFEMDALPGGQCAAWKRKGFTFDACIHHLFGCDPRFRLYRFWQELGAMPRKLVTVRDCVSVVAPDGRLFQDFYDPDRLRDHLLILSPKDQEAIDNYLRGIRISMERDIWGDLIFSGTAGIIRNLPTLWRLRSYLRPTLNQFALRFQDPFLHQAFPLLEYSLPAVPLLVHLGKKAFGAHGGISWPEGGSLPFARSISRHYEKLGGKVHYGKKVVKILTANHRATGIRLEDGSEVPADYVISNADGRKTILRLLEGRYLSDRVKKLCVVTDDETNWAVHVFLGVNRDLSREPSALVMLLDQPVRIADHTYQSVEMQIYGFDPTMAPPNKGVIKVELWSRYSYWKEMAEDRQRYEEEKAQVAETVIKVIERRFPGLGQQVEAIDVATLLTWERYMGGTHGFANMPNKPFDFIGSVLGRSTLDTLPGLSGFYQVGNWATCAGALFMNALSGRRTIQKICAGEGKKFTPSNLSDL